MSFKSLVECSFFIPVRRDKHLSDGKLHKPEDWYWLRQALYDRFSGGTQAPELYDGWYRDSETQERVSDRSRRYLVAVSPGRVRQVRKLLREACVVFQQKCIYLSVAGRVEFVKG